MQTESHKTIYQLFIKNISKLFLFTIVFTTTLACTKLTEGEISLNLDEVSCEVSNTSLEKFFVNDDDFQKNNKIFISSKEERYKKIIDHLNSTKKIDEETLVEEKYNKYNLIFLIDAKPSSGFNLKFNGAVLKSQNILNLYFQELSPEPNLKVNTVLTQPYCFLKIDNVDQYEVKVEVE